MGRAILSVLLSFMVALVALAAPNGKPGKGAKSAVKKAAQAKAADKKVASTPQSTPIPAASKALDFQSGDVETIVTSDTLTLNSDKREFSYRGNVKVTHGDMTMTAESVNGSYSEANEIQVITALTNVLVTKPDGTKASGQRAVYDAATQTVVFTEAPAIEQNGSILTADKITLYLNEDRSEASGQVRVKVIKKEEKKEPADSAAKAASSDAAQTESAPQPAKQ